MKIAFFGSSLVSAYWNGAATYYRGIIRALAERGHSITFYEPDAYERQQHRDMEDPEWARVVVYAGSGLDGVSAALDDARGADLVETHEPRVACEVSRDYGCEPASDAWFLMVCFGHRARQRCEGLRCKDRRLLAAGTADFS